VFFYFTMNEKAVLTTAYLAPIQYYTKLLRYNKVFIEIHDHFIKQSYRNRCKIYGANGLLQLSIPVKKENPKTKVKDIIIDYDTNWQKMHWKSIESAYRSSPFFEFYADDFIPYYSKKYKYLYEFNASMQETILSSIEMSPDIEFTKKFIEVDQFDYDDFRDIIHPKKKINDPDFKIKKYNQVFIEKYGFIQNLSIIDLLFNEGPNALNLLQTY